MDDHMEEWTRLCQQAAVEQDPDRLMKLVARIVELLDERRSTGAVAHVESASQANSDSGNA